MAKRVNTQFVAMLGTALAVVGAGVGGLIWYMGRHKVEDPSPLLEQAKQAEKAGDLLAAEGYYYRAANGTRDMHLPGADDLFFKVAQIDLKLSENAKTAEEGTKYLQHHVSMLQNAQGINPLNLQVAQQLIDEIYLNATTWNRPEMWLRLIQEVTRFINNQKGPPASAFTMRGEARMQWATSVAAKDVSANEYAEIEKDLTKALAMDPQAAKPVALYAHYLLVQAGRSRTARQLDDEKNFLVNAQTLLQKFLAGHPNEPETSAMYAIIIQYAAQRQKNYLDNHPGVESEPKEFMEGLVYDRTAVSQVLSEAYKAHPDTVQLGELLADFYLSDSDDKRFDRANSVLMDLQAAHPDDPQSYQRLAKFAQLKQKPPESTLEVIKWYKEGLNHIGPWSGLQNDYYQALQRDFLFRVAWTNMDLAEIKMNSADSEGVDHPDAAKAAAAEGTAALTEALAYSDKFQSQHGEKGLQELLDGRVWLLRKNPAEAIKQLRSADNDLGGGRGAPEAARWTKLLLAHAVLLQQPPQLGTALEYYNDLGPDLGDEPTIEKARVLVALARYDDAAKIMADLKAAKYPQWPADMQKAADKVIASADAGLGKGPPLPDLLTTGTPEALVEAANRQLAAGDVDGAMESLNLALEKDEKFLPAIQLAVWVNLQTHKLGEVGKLAVLGLKNYKDDPGFLYLKAVSDASASATTQPDEQSLEKILEKATESIADEYMKQSQFARLYDQVAVSAENARDPKTALENRIKELAALQKAEDVISDKAAPGNRSKATDLVERGFVSSLYAANDAQSPADKARYYAVAQQYETKAQQYDDEYTRFAALYDQMAVSAEKAADLKTALEYRVKEIAALAKAEELIPDKNVPGARSNMMGLVERGFACALYAANDAQSPPDKTKFYAVAQQYETKAEQYDLDGVGGQLYKGRLMFAKTPGLSAIAAIEKAVDLRPDFAPPRKILAQCYLSLTPPDEDKALEQYRKAVAAQPNDIGLLRSTILLLLRKYSAKNPQEAQLFKQEAQELLKQGLALSPNDPILTNIADDIGDPAAAIDRREAIRARNPADADNLRRLAILYAQKAFGEVQTLNDKTDAERATQQAAIQQLFEKASGLVRPLIASDEPQYKLGDTTFVATMQASEDIKDSIDTAMTLFDPFVTAKDDETRYEGLQALAMFCQKAGRYETAEKNLLAAVEMEKGKPNDYAARELGDLYFDWHKWADAEKTYRAIYQRAGENAPLVALRLIETLIWQVRKSDGTIDDAKAGEAEQLLIAKVFKDNPDDPQGLVLRAFLRVQQNKLDDAIADTKHVLEKHPDNAEAIYYRSMAQLTLGKDMNQAAGDLLALSDRYKGVPKYRILLLKIYLVTRNYAAAAGQYVELLDEHPELRDIRAQYANYLLELGLMQQRMGSDRTDAVAVAINNIKPIPTLASLLLSSMKVHGEENEPIWLLKYGDLAMVVGDMNTAQQAYERVYKVFPDNFAGVNSYLKLLVQIGQLDRAVDVATAYLNTPDLPDVPKNPETGPIAEAPRKHKEQIDIYMRRAAAYVGLKKDAEARADIDQVIALTEADGKNDQNHNYLAFVLALSQASEVVTPAGVVERLQARLGAYPNDYVASAGILHMLVMLNRSAEAVDLIKKTTLPADNAFIAEMFLRDSAMAYYQNKNNDAALAAYAQLIKTWPDDLEGLNDYASVLGELNRPRDALPYAERAVKIVDANPENYYINGTGGSIYDTYGWIKHLVGDEPGAIDQLQRAVAALPSPITYYHLAVAQKAAKHADDARKSAQLGIKSANGQNDPALPDLQQLLKDLGNG